MSGQVITFYSYKGGTGRTMALANIATLLSDKSKVLMIDGDLEAPGLHYFFKSKTINPLERPGLIDLFKKIEKLLEQHPDWKSDQHEKDLFNSIYLDEYLYSVSENNLLLLAAGRLNEDYPRQEAAFQWETLFYRAPWLFRSFARYLTNRFDYVLIDSRTGLNDISGICTALMPDKLMAIFTPSLQSIKGIISAIKSAHHYRKESDDLRPLNIFPVPSRLELQEKVLFDEWRFGSIGAEVEGYQPLFEELLKYLYNLEGCDLGYYFDNIQIQQVTYYAYGEKIAVSETQGTGRLSLSESYSLLTQTITTSIAPWAVQESQTISSSKVEKVPVDKVLVRRKPQLDTVLFQLTSQRPSDVWRGMEQVRRWLKEDPEDQEVYGLLLDAVVKNRKIREQVRNLLIEMRQNGSQIAKEAIPSFPLGISDLLVDADDAYYAAEYNKAIQLYRQVLRLDPENTRAKDQLAKAIPKRNTEESSTYLPRVARQYYSRARSFIAIREVVTAMDLLNLAIEAAQSEGVKYLEAEDALNEMQNLVLADEQINLAKNALQNGERHEAINYYQNALQLDPSNPMIRKEINRLQNPLQRLLKRLGFVN